MMMKKRREPAVVKDNPLDVARVMRKEALKNTGKAPTFRIYRGWRFGLSYGPVPMPTREEWHLLKDSLIKRLGLGHLMTAPSSYEDMLAAVAKLDVTLGDDAFRREWIFSASLHPRGRSSVQEDWRFYGEMAAAIGAPEGSLMTPIETTDPNAVHYHIWSEVAAPTPAKAN